MKKSTKKVGIIGCGWLGIRLAKHLMAQYQVFTTTTSEGKKIDLERLGIPTWAINFDFDKSLKLNENWLDLDAIIITVPFSKSHDVEQLKERFKTLSKFIQGFQKQVFLMSSVGIYPQINQKITETNLDESQLNPTILAVENLMKEQFPQINILRLGGLMGDDRYISKYKISEPNQIVNHIHFDDIVNIIEKMIDENWNTKKYNLVAPLHPTKQEVIDYQTQKVETKIQETYGREISSALLINDLKYQFHHPDPTKF